MNERSEMISWIRGELIGPGRALKEPATVEFHEREFTDQEAHRRGPLSWRPAPDAGLEEVLYFEYESPHRKYGAGLLHPAGAISTTTEADQAALQAADSVGAEPEGAPEDVSDTNETDSKDAAGSSSASSDSSDEFEVVSPDLRRPSLMSISFCVRLGASGQINVFLPQSRRFAWQSEDAQPFALNGRYELCKRSWVDADGRAKDAPIWRRLPAVTPGASVQIGRSELVAGKLMVRPVRMPVGSPIDLQVEVFPRRLKGETDVWLLTVVLRNSTKHSAAREPREMVLYQAYFEAKVSDGRFQRYPESPRPFAQLDSDEQSLALLYRESATWGIGHGCSAGWDTEPEQEPAALYADVLPSVQLPSMTPDIEVSGRPIQLSMRAMAALPDDGVGPAWDALENLAAGYDAWIQAQRQNAAKLNSSLAAVAARHLVACEACSARIRAGIALLRGNLRVRQAFRLANLSMLLQQIAAKQLARRPLHWQAARELVGPSGDFRSPWEVYAGAGEDVTKLGSWRAFQAAFLLMSLDAVRDGHSSDREVVDLIWFPTGGGKTEAYLAVMAFYMFHERLSIKPDMPGPARDGTNVLMRYTLRMLTTQQFQRAASLICAMEFLRRNSTLHGQGNILGRRFSLGLWIGGDGLPNKIREARSKLAEFRRGEVVGNPLVLTECPWCRSEIGRFEGSRPRLTPRLSDVDWNARRTRGITDNPQEGPLLHCTDSNCEFGDENPERWLPVEVIDERIYRYPPSLVIATADKLAMVAYRPDAGALFGRRFTGDQLRQECLPPGLIIQDELHLISGPLGTIYGLYEGIFERLCSYKDGERWIKPKLITSTATIRGAAEQVLALYARNATQLFPSPGLSMGDSFFGRYARAKGKLAEGRLYLGVHATEYGSVLTTQVRAFSSALFRPWSFQPERRDPWWSLLAFYNSIRELSGAKTLFDSDIRSRLKFMFNREGFTQDDRRNIRIVEELTSRLSQAEIVAMIDRLSAEYAAGSNSKSLDACLASNIIEVGVDIDRLSLMGVIGQPKTTATYIQVTGRVGRRWWERAGLIMMIYNPSKSRDRSHFEQFQSYHRRLYERVEPTTATPFALSAIQRGLPGALILWARQHCNAPVQSNTAYESALDVGFQLLRDRCSAVQIPEDRARSIEELERVRDELKDKWGRNPQMWEEFPPSIAGEYLMLWPGQFATLLQKQRGVEVSSSMRQVDRAAELFISPGYSIVPAAANPPPAAPVAQPGNLPRGT